MPSAKPAKADWGKRPSKNGAPVEVVRFCIDIPKDLRKRIKTFCAETERTAQAVCVEILARHFPPE